MLNMPMLKFEKSCNYLVEQLNIQKNNKQLILDIISNIGLLLNSKNEEQYDNILEEANEFLKIISANITAIEQLHIEIQNITKELNSVLENQSKGIKTKEFYIAALSNIKHTVIMYLQKFQDLEEYLSNTNNDFNDFINKNNFKYNFVILDENTNSYTFTGFSINESDEESNEFINDVLNTKTEDIIDVDIIEVEELSDIIEDVSQVIDENNVSEDSSSAITEVISQVVDENNVSEESSSTITEDISQVVEEHIVFENSNSTVNNNISKIDELTSEFRELLLHLSEANFTNNASAHSLASLFTSILPNINQNNTDTISTNQEIHSELDNEIQENEINDNSEESNQENNTSEKLDNDNFSEEDLENLLEEALLDDTLLEDVLSETNFIDNLLENEENNFDNNENEKNIENNLSLENNNTINEDNNSDFILDDSALFNQFMLQKLENDFIQESFDLFSKEFSVENNNSDEEFSENISSINSSEFIDITKDKEIIKIESPKINNEFEITSETTSSSLLTLENNLNETTQEKQIETLFQEEQNDFIDNENNFVDNEDDLIIEDEGVNEEIVNNIVENVLSIFVNDNTNITPTETTSEETQTPNNSFSSNMSEIEENIFDEYTSFEPARPIINYFKEPDKFLNIDNPFGPSPISDSTNIILNKTNNIATPIEDSKIINEEIINNDNNNIENNDFDDHNSIIEEIIFDNNNSHLDETQFDNNNSVEKENNIDDNSIIENILFNNNENFEETLETLDNEFIENSIFENLDEELSLEDLLSSYSTSIPEYEEISAESQNIESSNLNNIQNSVTINSVLHNNSSKNTNLSKEDFSKRLEKIKNAVEDNKTLLISEKLQKIYLPYKLSELVNYVESYPGAYKSLKDVVEQEFILPFNYFKKNPSKARFTETYNLLKNREGRTFIKSVSYAFRLLKKNNLNPAIIASCKTQHELDSYIYYLDSNNLNNFKFFNIIYEVNPM